MSAFGFGPDTDRLSALYRYGVLDPQPDPEFDAITRDVSIALGGMSVQMVLVDDHRLWIKSWAGALLDEGGKPGAMSAAVIEQVEPLVVNDARIDPVHRASPAVVDGPRLRAYAGLALRTSDNHAIGALSASDIQPRIFQPPHVTLLQHAADRVMEQLEFRRAERRDPVTGAMTQGAFQDQITALASLATRHKRDLSLLVIEIDPFRTLLESFKIDLGRLLIDRMGGLGRTDVRRLDSFARLSESRFAMLLPNTNASGANHLALRLVDKLAEGWSFPAPHGADATPVGIGVATLRPGLDTAADLTARALHECSLSRPGAGTAGAATKGSRVA